jgi:hypothetical protein
MGSATQTTHYHLPQFSDNDKPTWRGDINAAMAAIDDALTQNAQDISTTASHLPNLNSSTVKLTRIDAVDNGDGTSTVTFS